MGLRSGEYLGRKTRRAPTLGWPSAPPSPCGAGVVEDHSVARLEGRDEELLDIGAEGSPLIGPSNRQGASMRSVRRAARNVAVFHLPWDLVDEALSLRRQPRSRVMLVLVHVSSMKIRRRGSMRP